MSNTDEAARSFRIFQSFHAANLVWMPKQARKSYSVKDFEPLTVYRIKSEPHPATRGIP
jgi:hypothetical protein